MNTRALAAVVAAAAGVAVAGTACGDPNQPPSQEHATALASAQNHLRSGAFSEVRLRQTLIMGEGYEPEVAGWAIAHTGYGEADWVTEAKDDVHRAYQFGLTGDSRSLDQLEAFLIRDGFTKEQAERAVGY